MKRKNNLYQKIISLDNLKAADQIARRHKMKQRGVIKHIKNEEQNILQLHEELKTGTYRTGVYVTRVIREPKERIISIIAYIHRVVHHAIMIHLEDIFVRHFVSNSYACVKGKGVHSASRAIKKILKDAEGTKYCLKLDVKKFYPTIKHHLLKAMLRRLLKDRFLLNFLDEIIDSAEGLPIGNYLSQYFANLYLTPLDRYLKEELRVKKYVRYADDIVIFSDDKDYLHQLRVKIKTFLKDVLELEINRKYQVFLVASRGADIVGYKHFHKYTLLRNTIKKAFARVIARRKKAKDPKRFRASVDSYKGWAKHCNSKHLLKKLAA
jgi:retron-type reverse transcriptase